MTITHKLDRATGTYYLINNGIIGRAKKSPGGNFCHVETGNAYRTMQELKEALGRQGEKPKPSLLEALGIERKPIKTEADIWERLDQLAADLSPENLTCDGELPHRAVMARKTQIQKEWAQLEKALGRKVSEEDIWARWRAKTQG